MATVEQVLNIARGEIGVKENPPNSNEVKYNEWYYGHPVSGNAYPWCMAFVQWCFNEAKARLPYVTASCSWLLTWYQRNSRTQVVKEPKPGDIIIYSFGHTGIVESVSPKSIVAIEGNTSPGASGSQSNGGMVCRRTRPKSLVKAYIRPIYEASKKEIEDDMDFSKWSDNDFIAFADRMQRALSKKPVSSGLAKEFAEAKQAGITDGTSPCAFSTRAQSAVMNLRSSKN